MEKNRRSLVRSQSLYVLDTSLNETEFNKNMTEKMFKSTMLGYANNHTRYTYKLYNPDTKRVIMTRGVKCSYWKMTDPLETLKMFCKAHEEDLVPGIDKYKITTS